jgi:methylglutaconyl-CoA hydratase
VDSFEGGIKVLVLNRFEGRNSFSRALLQQLQDILTDLEEDPGVRSLIIRSNVPKVFCAGADLKERKTMKEEEVGPFVSSVRDLFVRIENFKAPTIACVEGFALGGGLEFALTCDMRVSSDKAFMGLPETKLAIIPGAGGTQRLPRIIGVAKAKELVFTGRAIDGAEALSLGLVNYNVPNEEQAEEGANTAAFEKCLEICRMIGENGPIGVRAAKRAINNGLQESSIANAMLREQEQYQTTIQTEDRLEALQAFSEKRKPEFKGR